MSSGNVINNNFNIINNFVGVQVHEDSGSEEAQNDRKVGRSHTNQQNNTR